MEAIHERNGQSEQIAFSRPAQPVHLIFAILPAIVALQTAVVLVLQPIPLTLIGIFLVVIGCCCALAVLFVDQLLPVTVKLDEGGLNIARTLGSSAYSWQAIEEVKVVGSTGTVGDDPTKGPSERIGLGIYLRAAGRDREEDDNPDVIVYTGSADEAVTLIRMADLINGYRGRLGGQRPAAKKFGGKPQARRGQLRTASA